jgi:MFS family permease
MRFRRYLMGGFRDLPASIWAIFMLQIITRGGDFVFPFLTLFLTRRLGLSSIQAGFWVMATVASGLLGTMAAGKLSDHFGRRRILGLCMLGGCMLTGLCGFLPPTIVISKVLLIASFFQGSVKPVLSAFVMDLCKPEQRKEGFSLSYLGTNVGVAVGPMVAGFLFENHLHWMFFGNSLAMACAIGMLIRFVPESGSSHPIPEAGPEQGATGSALNALLKRPLLVCFFLITLFVSFAYDQTSFGLTLYTSQIFGARGAAHFGFLMSFNAVLVLVFTALITRLTQRLSGPLAMALGTGFYTLGFAMLAFRLEMRLLMVSTLLWTTGEILLAINSGAYLASQTPWNFRGRFQAFREIVWSAGRILSPLAYGTIIAQAGIHMSWMVTALVTLICTGGFVLLHQRERKGLARGLTGIQGEAS